MIQWGQTNSQTVAKSKFGTWTYIYTNSNILAFSSTNYQLVATLDSDSTSPLGGWVRVKTKGTTSFSLECYITSDASGSYTYGYGWIAAGK